MKMKITITIKVTEEMEEWIIRLINKIMAFKPTSFFQEQMQRKVRT